MSSPPLLSLLSTPLLLSLLKVCSIQVLNAYKYVDPILWVYVPVLDHFHRKKILSLMSDRNVYHCILSFPHRKRHQIPTISQGLDVSTLSCRLSR